MSSSIKLHRPCRWSFVFGVIVLGHLQLSMRKKTILYCILSVVLILLCSAVSVSANESFLSPAPAEEETSDAIGPSIERRNALGYDPTRHSLFPDFYYRYRSWQESVARKIRLETIFSYDMLGQGYASREQSIGASSGDATISGRWLLFGQKYNRPVYASFRLRHRHAYGDRAPSRLINDTGLIWKTIDGFTDAGLQIPNVYVSQELMDGKLKLHYGQFSINSFFDNHKLRSSKRYFFNQIFSDNPSIAFPSYGAGGLAQWKDDRNWDVSIAVSNMQGTDEEERVSLSLDSSALFYNVQGGLNFAGRENRNARVQLLAWQNKGNQEEHISDGSGVSLTLEHEGRTKGEQFVARYAFSEGEEARVDQLFMIGWGREIRRYDHVGLGFGLGRSSLKNSRWQGLAEVYYRWQVTKEFMLTPDLQIIVGEGLEGGDTLQLVAGLRAGITF